MAATLSYVDHHPNPNTICTICLEPVAQQALKISCHLPLNCAECMNYWMEHQIGYRSRTSCPRCRSFVDSSNLTAPRGSIEWKDVDEMDWNGEEEYESYSSDEENGSSASDELAAIRPKDEDVRSPLKLICVTRLTKVDYRRNNTRWGRGHLHDGDWWRCHR